MRKIDISIQHWPFKQPVVTGNRTLFGVDVLNVAITENELTGFGEATGVYYLGETAESMLAHARAIKLILENDVCTDRAHLQQLLPAGGTRNAIDCALWDLESQRAGMSLWQYSGIPLGRLPTLAHLSLDHSPQKICSHTTRIRLTLRNDDNPLPWLTRFHQLNPQVSIIVDANQNWQMAQLKYYAPMMKELGVEVIEQPLARDSDFALQDYACPVVLCADESCQDRNDLSLVAKRYQMINIKLDKTGGLTEALALADAAHNVGLKIMVGNMMGSSLAMKPASVVAQLADIVDLDAPNLIQTQKKTPIACFDYEICHTAERMWG
ncbi:dipeptide epimerase [Neptunicella marina]|uniref:Dipeptide epimerase n=1 Tax=Neptunicella marina TaxID=2125989 RepID=A0A8J6ITL8_9ALTE|nr:dipeptide epimerase [Neptunicella marina]MBC3765615.1 dipeptide epimerase [Neptunicella marina]